MIENFFPNQYLKSIYQLNIEQLKEQGIKGIIFDIDNTLVPYDQVEPNERIIDFFETIRKQGIKITLVSNNTEKRVIKFNEKLKVFAVPSSKKPSRRGLQKAMQLMQCTPEQTIIVGDQIFTDIYAGNRAGVHTVLVIPVSEKDEWKTKIKRGIEKKVIRLYDKRNNNG